MRVPGAAKVDRLNRVLLGQGRTVCGVGCRRCLEERSKDPAPTPKGTAAGHDTVSRFTASRTRSTHLPMLPKSAFRQYALGLCCTVAGAAVTSLTGSMWPLALGAAVSVMCTVTWVRAVRQGAARRRKMPPGA